MFGQRSQRHGAKATVTWGDRCFDVSCGCSVPGDVAKPGQEKRARGAPAPPERGPRSARGAPAPPERRPVQAEKSYRQDVSFSPFYSQRPKTDVNLTTSLIFIYLFHLPAPPSDSFSLGDVLVHAAGESSAGDSDNFTLCHRLRFKNSLHLLCFVSPCFFQHF